MSLRLFYNQLENALQVNTIQNQLKISNGTNTIIHNFDTNNNYDIKHSDGTDLISFSSSKQLTNDCILHGHIQNRVAPLQRTLAEHSSTINDHENRLGTIETSTETNDNIQELANSIIHEYVHYKQNMKHYQILAMYLPDHKNPMEIEASKVAQKDTKKCLKDLFQIK